MKTMGREIFISITEDFSRAPYGRKSAHDEYNGERFREEYLKPALDSYEKVTVDLRGTPGLGPSFLEEAFGGLVRHGYITKDDFCKRLEFPPGNERNQRKIMRHLERARFGSSKGAPLERQYTSAIR